MIDRVHVVGATGRSGVALCQALAQAGIDFVPVVRSGEKFRASGLPGTPAIADLTDSFQLGRALRAARIVVSCAHARHTQALLDAARLADRFVLLGSTRRFSRWLDGHGAGVLAGETALTGSGRAGIMLHPTMIYGAQGEDNVQRLAALLRRLPLVPLPGGGRALVQPIHQSDLTRCLMAAIGIDWSEPRTLIVAGPTALPYAGFVRAVASAAGLRAPRIVAMPAGLLMAAAPIASVLPFLPNIAPAEIRRLLEDKAFPVGAMFATLGVRPIPLEQGLALTFAKEAQACP
jgi:nucleoside-diphosphate-sugar epimerase